MIWIWRQLRNLLSEVLIISKMHCYRFGRYHSWQSKPTSTYALKHGTRDPILYLNVSLRPLSSLLYPYKTWQSTNLPQPRCMASIDTLSGWVNNSPDINNTRFLHIVPSVFSHPSKKNKHEKIKNGDQRLFYECQIYTRLDL